MKKHCLFSILLLAFISISAQNNRGLRVIQSDSISKLVEKHKAVNEAHYEINGWRIQIFSTGGRNSRDLINLQKAEFLSKYSDIQVYIVYQAPYFKLRIGNFRSKMEALYLIEQIKEDYPFAFAVIDKIEPPQIQ